MKPPTGSWSPWFDGRYGNAWDYVMPDSGVVLYEELGLGALKGLSNTHAWGYQFQPFPDGSFQAELRTGNDFQVMEAALCRKLRNDPYCQGPSHTAFRY